MIKSNDFSRKQGPRGNPVCNRTRQVIIVTPTPHPPSWFVGFLSLWASCQIRKIAGCACACAGNVFPATAGLRPDMHHGTCVTHVPWSLTNGFLWSRWRGKRSRYSRRMCNPQFYMQETHPFKPPISAVIYENTWQHKFVWFWMTLIFVHKYIIYPQCT